MSMTKREFLDYLHDIGACDPGIAMVENFDAETAKEVWDGCPVGPYLSWLVEETFGGDSGEFEQAFAAWDEADDFARDAGLRISARTHDIRIADAIRAVISWDVVEAGIRKKMEED